MVNIPFQSAPAYQAKPALWFPHPSIEQPSNQTQHLSAPHKVASKLANSAAKWEPVPITDLLQDCLGQVSEQPLLSTAKATHWRRLYKVKDLHLDNPLMDNQWTVPSEGQAALFQEPPTVPSQTPPLEEDENFDSFSKYVVKLRV